MIKHPVFIKIDDYRQTKKYLRMFMNETKSVNNLSEKLARIRYLKQIQREINGFLRNRNMLRRK